MHVHMLNMRMLVLMHTPRYRHMHVHMHVQVAAAAASEQALRTTAHERALEALRQEMARALAAGAHAHARA